MQRKTIKKKCLAWLLSLAVALTFIPLSAGVAFAADYDLNNATIEVSDVQYTGFEVEPTVTVKDGEGVDVNASEYDVSYANNINIGTSAQVTITAKDGSSYTGSKTANFAITKVDLSTVPHGNFFLSEGNYDSGKDRTEVQYDGNEHHPGVSKVRIYKGPKGKKDITTGYDVSYPDTSGGSYTMAKENNRILVTASADSEFFTGSATVYFDIIDSITDVKVGTSVGYNGTVNVAASIALDDAEVITTTELKSGYGSTEYTTEKYMPIEKLLTKAGVAFADGNALQLYTGSTLSPYGKYSPMYADLIASKWYVNQNLNTVMGTNIPAALALEYKVGTSTTVETAKAPLLLIGCDTEGSKPNAGKYFATGVTQIAVVDTDIEKLSPISAQASVACTGKELKPGVVVKDGSVELAEGTDYDVAYADNTNVGTATATITGKGKYSGTATTTFTITKGANTLAVKAKAAPKVKKSKLKKKAQKLAANKVMTVTNAKGAVTYAKVSGSKKLSIAKNGQIKIKKKTKKGTYKMTVKVTAAGNANFNAASKNVTIQIKVK